MPTPGPLELVIILVIALLVLGPGKLPDVGRRARQEHQGIPQGVLGRPGGGQGRRRHVAAARPRRQPAPAAPIAGRRAAAGRRRSPPPSADAAPADPPIPTEPASARSTNAADSPITAG